MTTRIWAMVAITIWTVCTVGTDSVSGRETLNDEREKYPFLLEAIAGKFIDLARKLYDGRLKIVPIDSGNAQIIYHGWMSWRSLMTS